MKQVLIAFGALIVVIAAIAFFMGTGKVPTFNIFGLPGNAKFAGKTFQVRVARSDKDLQIGLSKTASLSENQGMLFVFKTKSKYGFWMRDMKFPIDVIFIDDNKVVDIKKNFKPSSDNNIASLEIYKPKADANYVLEVNEGLADKYNIKEGNKVEFSNI